MIKELKELYNQNKRLDNRFYEGIVKENGDPEKVSRVKVEIEELTKGIPTEDLPWYSTLKPFGSGNNSSANIPPIGSRVIVEFPDNDIYNGVIRNVLVSKPPIKG